jgi:hypothetical protein
MAETSLKVSYIRNKFRDALQDFDRNHAPGDFGVCKQASLIDPTTVTGEPDGILDDCVGEIEIPRNQLDENDDPFASDKRIERPDGITDLYIQNPAWGDIFLIGNFNKIDYTGYVLEITRRQYRSWEMNGSYTFSRSIGDGEDYDQFLGDDRSLQREERGYQANDRRHSVKVNATTITPWGIRLGGTMSWQSGLPFSVLRQGPSFDAVPPDYGNLAGNRANARLTYPTGVRNDQRNQSYWDFNVRASKEMRLSRGLNLQVSAEVFNLFNEDTYYVYNTIADAGFQINGINDGFRNFGRRWQLGAKLAF